jgi:hypothetical protein
LKSKKSKHVDAHAQAGQERWKDVPLEERTELMRAAARARWGLPKKPKEKDAAAVALVQRRWNGKTHEERKEIMKQVRKGRAASKKTK